MTRPDDDISDEYAALVFAQDAIQGLLDAAEGRVFSGVELDDRLNELRRRVAGNLSDTGSE
jgi:hypothetical protein